MTTTAYVRGTIYVVMKNDMPCAAYRTKKNAIALVEAGRDEERRKKTSRKIRWELFGLGLYQ